MKKNKNVSIALILALSVSIIQAPVYATESNGEEDSVNSSTLSSSIQEAKTDVSKDAEPVESTRANQDNVLVNEPIKKEEIDEEKTSSDILTNTADQDSLANPSDRSKNVIEDNTDENDNSIELGSEVQPKAQRAKQGVPNSEASYIISNNNNSAEIKELNSFSDVRSALINLKKGDYTLTLNKDLDLEKDNDDTYRLTVGKDNPVNLTITSKTGENYKINYVGDKNPFGGMIDLLGGSKLTLDNITLDGNQNIGGIRASNSELTLKNGSVIQNIKGNNEGAIYIYGSNENSRAKLILEKDSKLINNEKSSSDGGGILAEGNVDINIDSSEISGNRGSNSGGIKLDEEYGNGFIGTIVANISDTKITNNSSTYYGGGIGLSGSGVTLNLSGGEVSNNISKREKKDSWYNFGQGGGIYNKNATLNIKNTEIKHNKAPEGGGIFITNDAKVNISEAKITENTSTVGGGIYSSLVKNDTVINKTEIRKNTSEKMGGGVFLFGYKGYGYSNLKLSESKINENTANNGGGIYLYGSSANIDKSEITNNKASQYGGGIYKNKSDQNLNITGSNFKGNSAIDGGGIFTEDHFYGDKSYNYSHEENYQNSNYQHLSIDDKTNFSKNTASNIYKQPYFAEDFTNLKFASTSAYDHIMNNADLNFKVYVQARFNKLDNTTELSKILDENVKFPKEDIPPMDNIEGKIYKGWFTQKDGKGDKFDENYILKRVPLLDKNGKQVMYNGKPVDTTIVDVYPFYTDQVDLIYNFEDEDGKKVPQNIEDKKKDLDKTATIGKEFKPTDKLPIGTKVKGQKYGKSGIWELIEWIPISATPSDKDVNGITFKAIWKFTPDSDNSNNNSDTPIVDNNTVDENNEPEDTPDDKTNENEIIDIIDTSKPNQKDDDKKEIEDDNKNETGKDNKNNNDEIEKITDGNKNSASENNPVKLIKNSKSAPKTGVSGIGGMLGIMFASGLGLFTTRKKDNE